MVVCSVDGCGREVNARGWCERHYQRWRAHGDPEHVPYSSYIPRNKLPAGRAARNKLLASYRYRARRGGLIWNLADEQAIGLFQSNCYYCGCSPSNETKWETYTRYIHNGIDRLDNDIGYVRTNCVPCCKECNYMKRTMLEEDFIGQCIRIAQHWSGVK